MLDANARRFAAASVHAGAGGEWPVRELPCGALHSTELAVDANHADASLVDEANPKVVATPTTDLGAEPFLCARHAASLSKVYQPRLTRSVSARSGPERQRSVMKPLLTAVRPLGFEPRTCGLRDRFNESHQTSHVSDVRFCLRFHLSSTSSVTRGRDLRVRLRAARTRCSCGSAGRSKSTLNSRSSAAATRCRVVRVAPTPPASSRADVRRHASHRRGADPTSCPGTAALSGTLVESSPSL